MPRRITDLLQDVIDAHAHPAHPEYNGCDKAPCTWCVSAKSHLEELP